MVNCIKCNTELKKVFSNGGNLKFCPNESCPNYLKQINTAYRTEKERQQFFMEHDGWTEFKTEKVNMFGVSIVMAQCVKCNHITPLFELFKFLSPLHFNCCGRTTLEQDREFYKRKLDG